MIDEIETRARRAARRPRAFARFRAGAGRPAGARWDSASGAAHRAILDALGLPPFVSPRTLRMLVAEMPAWDGGGGGGSMRRRVFFEAGESEEKEHRRSAQ